MESLNIWKKSSGEQVALASETGLMHRALNFSLILLAGSGEEEEVEGWRLTSRLFNGGSYLGFTIMADSRFLCVLRLRAY